MEPPPATALPASLTPPLLEVDGLSRTVDERILIENISISIRGGDRMAIVGSSGSGKTVLLRALAILDPVDSGEIRWRGVRVAGNGIPDFRAQAMYLHQRPALEEGTVEENLRAPFQLRVHRGKQFDRGRMVQRLESLGRDASFLEQEQRVLSGGEAQLTALLRALQFEPLLLLLDEPTAALDSGATEMVEQLIHRWLDERPSERATVWVTHDFAQADRVSDVRLRMQAGRLS